MSKKSYALIILTAVLIAILAGFFASTKPDGLEKVAGMLKLEGGVNSIPGGAITTALSGIFGIILILFVFRSISKANYIGEIIKKLLNLR